MVGGGRQGKQPVFKKKTSAKKTFVIAGSPRKFAASPRSPGSRASWIKVHWARFSKDCDGGKKGELTGNIYVAMLPKDRNMNDPMKRETELVALGEYVRWQQELKLLAAAHPLGAPAGDDAHQVQDGLPGLHAD